MELTEKIINSRQIYKGRVVDLSVNTVELPDGSTADREVIAHPGGVCVFAMDDERNVFMVRQFRSAAGKVILEIPAGKLEYGEEPSKAGVRELEEEVGYKAEELVPLGYFYPTPAYCGEKIYMFYAKGLKKTNQSLDDEEFLEVVKIPFHKLCEMVINDEIIDGKTALATLRVKAILDNEI